MKSLTGEKIRKFIAHFIFLTMIVPFVLFCMYLIWPVILGLFILLIIVWSIAVVFED